MADFRNIPEPNYEYDVDELTRAYREAVSEIQDELTRTDLTDLSRAKAQSVLAQVTVVLNRLTKKSFDWVKRVIPSAAIGGVMRTLMALGLAKTPEEAREKAKLNRMNQNMVAAAVADTQSDLLAVTNNIDRRVRAAVRRAVGDVMRANMAKGVNGTRTLSADVLARVRKELGDAANNAIIDARGRRWKVETYVDMVARTKTMYAHTEATMNEALGRGVLYGIVSSHGAKDACRFHEGRIIRLTDEGDANYPTYEQLRSSGQIWHPNCRHTVSPVRRPDDLPERVREKAEKQAEIGDKAIATGRRNPTDVE